LEEVRENPEASSNQNQRISSNDWRIPKDLCRILRESSSRVAELIASSRMPSGIINPRTHHQNRSLKNPQRSFKIPGIFLEIKTRTRIILTILKSISSAKKIFEQKKNRKEKRGRASKNPEKPAEDPQ